jgi:hypothetical protein
MGKWTRVLVTCLSLALCSALTLPAQAQDDARLGLGLRALVKGKERPAITVSPGETVKSLKVTLRRQDGKVQTLKSGKIRAGQVKMLNFKQPQGVFEYTAKFDVRWGNGDNSSFETTFKATKVGELSLKIGPGDVDLEARTLVFRITNPAQRAELLLLGERGKRIGHAEVTFDDTVPGEPLTIAWGELPAGEELLRMDLKVFDVANFWAGMQITPFSIEIPHEELVFETGRHKIKATEAPKLQRTLAFIHEALAKHGSLLALKLYIGGYTDTVGGRGPNLELSNRRAKSIAGWFRANGIKVPIYFQGFGEDALAKPTPDQTPEAANRRAIYVLSSQAPSGNAFPRSQWRRL